MAEAARIAEQMRRVMVGGAWHGPSVLEAIDGMSAKSAAAHPIAGAHSIWELVLHIDATQRLILARLKGENPAATESDFFPPVADTSEAAWKASVARLKTQEEQLVAAAAALSDAQLAAALPGGSTAYEILHGHAQHNAFHAGQLRLLRKATGA
jgi:uncharacterized damage-inducible protein DinB